MRKILAIALDAAEPSLIDQWMADGTLPTLKQLHGHGAHGRLSSPAKFTSGCVWPTFYTGTSLGRHGICNYLMWNSENLTSQPPTEKQLVAARPFWRNLKNTDDPRSIVIDIPFAYFPEPFNGMEIANLAMHDALVPMAGHPPGFLHFVKSRYGRELMSKERYGLQTKREFIETRDEMIRLVHKVGGVCEELVSNGNWDFFLTSFAFTHRAGHRLWDWHNVSDAIHPEEQLELSEALHKVYMACDQVIGRLVAAAGPQTTVVIFSLHGMKANTSRTTILPEMLHRVLYSSHAEHLYQADHVFLHRFRSWVPSEIRHRAKSMLPIRLRHRLTAFWQKNPVPWSKTKAFSMIADDPGWIRVNLKGREKYGLVEPGREVDDLYEEIIAGLCTFVDQDTGRPLVKEILRVEEIFGANRPDTLPDLIVLWNDTPAHLHRAVVSPKHGRISWPAPGCNPDGRSGNHQSEGMFIAVGPGVQAGRVDHSNILDLAPTILTLLGQPIPAAMEGKILPLLKPNDQQ